MSQEKPKRKKLLKYLSDPKYKKLFKYVFYFSVVFIFSLICLYCNEYESKKLWINFVAIATLVGLSYYIIRTISIIRKGLIVEHKEQGSVPILSLAYTFFTIYFMFEYINQYENIINELDELCPFISHGNYYKDIFYEAIRVLFIASLLIGLGWNISKSILTLNSLEFGVFQKFVEVPYDYPKTNNDIVGKDTNVPTKFIGDFGKLFLNKDKKIIRFEGILRFIICIAFIVLETVLADSTLPLFENFIGDNTILNLGIITFILFSLTLYWFRFNIRQFGDDFIEGNLKKYIKLQFRFGIAIAVYLFLLGFSCINQLIDIEDSLLLLFAPSLFCTGGLIWFLLKIEYEFINKSLSEKMS